MTWAALVIVGMLAAPQPRADGRAPTPAAHASLAAVVVTSTVGRPHGGSRPGDPLRYDVSACSDEEDGDGDDVFAPSLPVATLPALHPSDRPSAFTRPRPAGARALSSPHPLRC